MLDRVRILAAGSERELVAHRHTLGFRGLAFALVVRALLRGVLEKDGARLGRLLVRFIYRLKRFMWNNASKKQFQA